MKEEDQALLAFYAETAPDMMILLVARALDKRADELGRNHQARMIRTLATQAHLLWMTLCGADELRNL